MGVRFRLSEDCTIISVRRNHTGYETVIQVQEGRIRSVVLSVRPIAINTQISGLLLIHDIDQMKRIQSSLRQANNQLSLLNSITRHDILNRVMVVRSYCEILLFIIMMKRYQPNSALLIKQGEDIQCLIEFYQSVSGPRFKTSNMATN